VFASEALEARRMLTVTAVSNGFGTQSSSPRLFAQVGDLTFFTTIAGTNALWTTDPISGQTTLVKDFGTVAGDRPTDLTAGDGVVYFVAGGATGREVWKSDGTAAGTSILKDVVPGSGSSYPESLYFFNGNLYFGATDSAGPALWKSDGTTAGTNRLLNIAAGSAPPASLLAVGNTLYFNAFTPATGNELWKTDGTAAGTSMVLDIYPGTMGGSPHNMIAMNGVVYFAASNSLGTELWRSDGTGAGTRIVKDINPGSAASFPSDFAVKDGRLFFAAETNSNGRELWSSDGTAAWTFQVDDLNGSGSSSPSNLVVVDHTLFFSADDGSGPSLWTESGVDYATLKLPALKPQYIVSYAGLAWFSASSSAGTELWSSDGSIGGTAMFKDVAPGAEDGLVSNLAVGGDNLYFAAYQYGTGEELWMADGVADDTALVKDLNTTPLVAPPSLYTEYAGSVYFTTSAGGFYRTDGTPDGTTRISYLSPTQFKIVGSTLYFTTGDGTRFPSVWKTDGTFAGTQLVRQFTLPLNYGGTIGPMAVYNGKLMFSTLFTMSSEIWVSDGTSAGTTILQNTGNPNRAIGWRNPVQVGPLLYFYGYAENNQGWELWRTDGTAAGTFLVKDVETAGNSSFDNYGSMDIEELNGAAIYAPLTAQYNRELWRSDATGTSMILDINGTSAGSIRPDPDPSKTLVKMGDYIYFFSDTSLWRTDGTAAGTTVVAAIDPNNIYPLSGLTQVGNRLFFIKQRTSDHAEYDLWTSDGTAGNALLLRRFYVDSTSNAPGIGSIVDVNGVAYFEGWDTIQGSGIELWRSDGTVAGTLIAGDINGGVANSNPASLTPTSSGLYLTATSSSEGTQVWKESANELPPAPTNLVLTALGPFKIQLTWSAPVDGSITYRVDRSLTADFPTQDDSVFVPVGITQFVDPVVQPKTHYYYRVVAINSAGTSSSAVANLITPAVSFDPGGVQRVDSTFTLPVREPFSFGGQVYVDAYTAATSTWQAYRSDGQSYTLIAPFAIEDPVVLGNRFYFRNNNAVWVSDGTAGNTVLALNQAATTKLWTFDGKLYFGHNTDLWVSNGTDAGSHIVDPATSPRLAAIWTVVFNSGSSVREHVTFNGDLYYLDSTEQQIYKAVGDTAIKVASAPAFPGSGWNWSPNHLSVANGYVYFFAKQYLPTISNDYVLYRTDGTPEGTVPIKDVGTGRFSSIVSANGTLYFTSGGTMWASDGTEAGTIAIKTYPAINGNYAFSELSVVSGHVYFNFRYYIGNKNAGELWTSDGTVEGTVKVEGLPNTTDVTTNSPITLTSGADALYFLADLSTANNDRSKLFRDFSPPTGLAIPDAPSDFTATAFSAGQVTLSWHDNSRNEEGFRIEQSTSSTFETIDKTITVLPNITHYVDLSVAPSTTYYYRLVAFNTGGDTAPLFAGPATTPAGTAAPTGLSLTEAVNGERIDLAWTDQSTHETGFVVERSTAFDFVGGGVVSFNLPAGSTAFSDTTIARLTKYYYRVYAVGADGYSPATSANITSSDAKPLAPTDLLAWAVSDSQIDLQWTDVAVNESAVGGYTVERGDKDGVYTLVASLPKNSISYSDTGLTAGEFYNYRVRAVNAINPSDAVVSATVRTLPPQLATTVVTLPTLPGSTQERSADPTRVVTAGGKGYFFATDGSNGTPILQLWSTDGTAQNTVLVKSYFRGGSRFIGTAGNLVYFLLADINEKTFLYRSDGTAAGTFPLIGLFHQSGGESMNDPYEATEFGGQLYFLITDFHIPGVALYRSDGTLTGTVVVKSFTSLTPTNLTVRNGTLYFNVNGTLYQSDGTGAGTVPSSSVVPGIGAAERVTDGDKTYYVTGNKLYVNDGVSDTLLVTAVVGSPSKLRIINGKLFYILRSWDATQTNQYSDLYVTDGTVGGETLIKRFTYGGTPGVLEVQKVGSNLYLTINNGANMELWRTDGSIDSTGMIESQTAVLDRLGAVGNWLTFESGATTQLYSTTGEPNSAMQISNIGNFTAHPDWITPVGQSLYYISSFLTGPGSDPAASYGVEIWKTDTTTNQSTRLFVGNPRDLTLHNGVLYFISSTKLYKIDPADDVPVFIKDIGFGGRIAASSNGTLYLGVWLGGNSGLYQLWKTDGTAAGTVQVGTTNIFLNVNPDYARFIATSGGYFYFLDGIHGSLWRTDGSTTTQIAGIGLVDQIKDVQGTLYAFQRNYNFDQSVYLYTIDHAAASATLVKQINGPGFATLVTAPTAVGNKLYFGAQVAGQGYLLWSSDGTQAGTAPFLDMFPDNTPGVVNDGVVDSIVDANGTAYVIGYNARTLSGSLWRTDGTTAGSVRIRAINRSTDAPRPVYLTVVNGLVIYSDGDYLWRSDGTLEGTIHIDSTGVASDGNRSVAGWAGPAYAVIDSRIYFTGAIPGTGQSLRVAYLDPPASPDGLTIGVPDVVSDGPLGAPLPAPIAGGVKLTWHDRSSNESSFLIERSTTPNFTVIDKTFFAAANATQFVDASASVGDNYYYRVRAVNAGGNSTSSNLISAGAPGVLQGTYDYAAAQRKIIVQFSADVSASLTADDIHLIDLATGLAVDASAFTLAFDHLDNSATIAFSALPKDGIYRLTLRAAEVTDATGATLDGNGDGISGDDYQLDFFELKGDANRDKTVSFADLVAVAQHYGTDGNGWAQGDFNGDGTVSFSDLVVVAQNYGTSLPPMVGFDIAALQSLVPSKALPIQSIDQNGVPAAEAVKPLAMPAMPAAKPVLKPAATAPVGPVPMVAVTKTVIVKPLPVPTRTLPPKPSPAFSSVKITP
jgi:ELWxxDGT repeat protein